MPPANLHYVLFSTRKLGPKCTFVCKIHSALGICTSKDIIKVLPYHLYTILIRTPPFPAKDANFCTLYIIPFLVQQKCKHGKMVFLTSRGSNKHVLFALGVNPTARDIMKVAVLT